jgi:hypothetical protein
MMGMVFAAKAGKGREGSCSLLKKRTKKLFVLWSEVAPTPEAQPLKVFWFFFSKKNSFSMLTLDNAR